MTPGQIVPKGSTVVQPGQLHPSTVSTIVSYLPGILLAIGDALAISRETGHVPTTQVVMDSINAGTSVLGAIPNSHIQAVSQIVDAVLTSATQEGGFGGGKT